MYVGVDGVARKIKKGYIGVGGVARLFYLASGQIVHTGELYSYTGAKATTNSSYALFAGGYAYSYTSSVRSINSSFTVGSATSLPQAVTVGGAATIGNYCIFYSGTGYTESSSDFTSTYGMAYDTSLTSTELSVSYKSSCGSAANSGYAFFAGGCRVNGASSNYYSSVDKYNSSLTSSSATSLSKAKANMGSATVNNYCLFAGGIYSSSTYYSTVEAYNSSGTKSTLTDLNTARRFISSGSINNNALFIGGSNADGDLKSVDCYNSSLTHSVLADFPIAWYSCATANTEDKLLICGPGHLNLKSSTIYAYDKSLTCTTHSQSLLNERWGMAGTTFNSYAIFGCGKLYQSATSGTTEKTGSLMVFN